MAGSIAHIVQIVVLAVSAHAFLRGGRTVVIARLDAGEQVLELDHARVHEHQRRIVARNQRAGRDNLVPLFFEKVQKCGSDVVQRGHVVWAFFGAECSFAMGYLPIWPLSTMQSWVRKRTRRTIWRALLQIIRFREVNLPAGRRPCRRDGR